MFPFISKISLALGLAGSILAASSAVGITATHLVVPPKSKFSANLNKPSYQQVKGPEKPLAMSMDFSGNTDYVYDFSQNIEGAHWDGQSDLTTSQKISVKGDLLLKSQGDRTADLVFDAMTVDTTLDFQGEKKTMRQAVPGLELPGVGENGRIGDEAASRDLVFQIMFSLPDEPLELGQTFHREVTTPFSILGAALLVKGSMEITLSGFVLIDGALCARLEGDITLADIQVPENLQGIFSSSVKGRYLAFFDLEDRSFAEGRIALLMSMTADAPLPESEKGTEGKPSPPHKRMQMEIVNDNLVVYYRKTR